MDKKRAYGKQDVLLYLGTGPDSIPASTEMSGSVAVHHTTSCVSSRPVLTVLPTPPLLPDKSVPLNTLVFWKGMSVHFLYTQ